MYRFTAPVRWRISILCWLQGLGTQGKLKHSCVSLAHCIISILIFKSCKKFSVNLSVRIFLGYFVLNVNCSNVLTCQSFEKIHKCSRIKWMVIGYHHCILTQDDFVKEIVYWEATVNFYAFTNVYSERFCEEPQKDFCFQRLDLNHSCHQDGRPKYQRPPGKWEINSCHP